MADSLESILNELKKEAPLTTKDIKMRFGTNGRRLGASFYYCPIELLNRALVNVEDLTNFLYYDLGLDKLDKYYDIKNSNTVFFNYDGKGNSYNQNILPNKGTVAHELTHAYLWRYAKEARGYVELIKKIIEKPELKEKLIPIAKQLEKKAKEYGKKALFDTDVEDEIYYLDEALAWSIGQYYGDKTVPNFTFFSTSSDGVKERMKPCKELIDLLGIDGARGFVRNELRQIYESGKVGASLEKKVKEYEEALSAFFNTMDSYCKQ